jgi:hypothetical protein
MPIAIPVAAGAPLLCGKRLPNFITGSNETGEPLQKPHCRRCVRAFWKIRRRARRTFEENVEADLAALPAVEDASG